MTPPEALPHAEELVAHAEFVRRLARSLVWDPHLAEDVAQDALLAGLAADPTRTRSLRAWFAGTVRNLARMRARSESRRGRREDTAPPPRALPSPYEVAERLEIQRRVVEAVLALEEPLRSTVVFRFFHDMGPTEIARRTGVPVDTVKTRLRRGLDGLRTRLDRVHGESRGGWLAALVPLAGERPTLPVTGAAAQGVLMATGSKAAFAVCAVLGALLGFAGHAVLQRAEPEVAPPPAPDAAALRSEAARLREENRVLHSAAVEKEAAARENVALRGRVADLESRLAAAAAAAAPPAPSEATVGKAAPKAPPPSKDLDDLPWDTLIPLLEAVAEAPRDRPMDPDLMRKGQELVQRISSRVEVRPGADMEALWRMPGVGSRIAVASLARAKGGLPAEERRALQAEIERILAVPEAPPGKPRIPIEEMALVLDQVARAAEALAARSDPTAAGSVVRLIGAAWQQTGWSALDLETESRETFPATCLQVWGLRTKMDEAMTARAREIAQRWFAEAAALQDRLVSEFGAERLRAALVEAPPAGGAKADALVVQSQIRARLAALQARYEREVYDALPEESRASFTEIEPALLLFRTE